MSDVSNIRKNSIKFLQLFVIFFVSLHPRISKLHYKI